MQLTVIHRAFEDQEIPVAEVEAGGRQGQQALDYAYALTQNTEGSWSRGELFEDGTPNSDFDPAITVIKPLEVVDGHVWGHRSTCMGDIIVMGGVRWVVAGVGFVLESEYDEELV